jgi:gas vesicle protein
MGFMDQLLKNEIMKGSKVILAFLGGIAVGAIAGILLAPDKGSNTRKAIREMAEDFTDTIGDNLKETLDRVKEEYAEAVEEGERIAQEVVEKVTEIKKDVSTGSLK